MNSASRGSTLEQAAGFISELMKHDWAVRIITSPYIEGYLRVRFATRISHAVDDAFGRLSGLPVEIDWDGSTVSTFQANVIFRSGKVQVLDLRPDWMKAAKLHEMIEVRKP